MIETGWLIEKTDENGKPFWLTVKNELFDWTDDPNKPIRFCRREDAEMVAGLIGQDAEKITEHEWG